MKFYLLIFILFNNDLSINFGTKAFKSAFVHNRHTSFLKTHNYHPSIKINKRHADLTLNNVDSSQEYEPLNYKLGELTHLQSNNFKLKGANLEKDVLPINDYVLVVKNSFNKVSKSGVYIGTKGCKDFLGKVLAVGPGKLNKTTGVRIPVNIAVGDTVVFDTPTEKLDLKYGDRECVLVKEDQIFARIKDSNESYDSVVTYDKILPLADRMLVRVLDSPRRTESGLVISRSRDDNDLVKGVVVSLGPGVYADDGKLVPLNDLVVGDVVLYKENNFDGGDFSCDNKNFSFVKMSSVVAKL